MLLWLLLLILAPGREQSGMPPKAFIFLNPPWSTTFKGKKVTLTCKDLHSQGRGDVVWYIGDKLLANNAKEIQVKESGSYTCKTQASSFSDPVLMRFLSDEPILQASHPVFEGEDVLLRCRGKNSEENSSDKCIYYRDGNKVDVTNSYFIENSDSARGRKYHCTKSGFFGWRIKTSNTLIIQVQELFPQPVLTISPLQPIEGISVTLKCETWLPPRRSNPLLLFCFFRKNQILGSGWSSSPELSIPVLWSKDSGDYWCQAQTTNHSVIKSSLRSWINVQRVPVSAVKLEIQPPEGQLIEGENLLLICSAVQGTGAITFSWHREGTSLGRKTQRSLSAELRIPSVKERDAGRYYCTADNSEGPAVLSEWVTVTLKIPVSRPVLTLRGVQDQAMVGDVVELHCEVERGSPPILYRFYSEDVNLGNSSALSGGGASLNLTLIFEHSAKFSCEADNGLETQSSVVLTLNITGTSGKKTTHIAAKVTGGLLSVLGVAALAILVGSFRIKRKSGELPSPGTSSANKYQNTPISRHCGTESREITHFNSQPLTDLQPEYSNVNSEDTNLVYSQIWNIQQAGENSENSSRMHHKDNMELTSIYSAVKKELTDDSKGQDHNRNMIQKSATEDYENIS